MNEVKWNPRRALDFECSLHAKQRKTTEAAHCITRVEKEGYDCQIA